MAMGGWRLAITGLAVAGLVIHGLVIDGLAQPAAAPPVTLKATIRMSLAKVDLPTLREGERPSPYGNFGPLLSQMLTPEGPVDIQYVIAGDQTRADVQGRLATLPKGSVVIQKMGEDTIRVLNPNNRTWYEIPANQNLGVLLGAPDVTIEPTAEQATIAGHRAERFRFRQTLRIPVPEGTALPADFPQDLQLHGDLWSTDAFSGANYAGVFRTLQAFAAIPGIEALTAGGRFPLRIALRSSIMPGYEIRSEVVSIGPIAAEPSRFAVPAGYQKVQAPGGGQEANSSTPQLRNSAMNSQTPTPKTPKRDRDVGRFGFLDLGVLEIGILGVDWKLRSCVVGS